MSIKYDYPFNLERYLQLLNKEKEDSKSLLKSERLELICYSGQLADSLLWKKQSQYYLLIEAFISYEIDADEFDREFVRLGYDDAELNKLRSNPSLKILKNLQIGPEYDSDFPILRANIDAGCELFERAEDDFTEDTFRVYVKKEYKEFLENDSSINVKSESESNLVGINPIKIKTSKNNPVLRETMIFFVISGLFAYTFLKPELFDIFWN